MYRYYVRYTKVSDYARETYTNVFNDIYVLIGIYQGYNNKSYVYADTFEEYFKIMSIKIDLDSDLLHTLSRRGSKIIKDYLNSSSGLSYFYFRNEVALLGKKDKVNIKLPKRADLVIKAIFSYIKKYTDVSFKNICMELIEKRCGKCNSIKKIQLDVESLICSQGLLGYMYDYLIKPRSNSIHINNLYQRINKVLADLNFISLCFSK